MNYPSFEYDRIYTSICTKLYNAFFMTKFIIQNKGENDIDATS